MERGLAGSPRFEVRHASQVIGMDESPVQAVRGKKDSSMRVCFELVRAGAADAVVSAGNSGAMLACGLFVLKRLPAGEHIQLIIDRDGQRQVAASVGHEEPRFDQLRQNARQ